VQTTVTQEWLCCFDLFEMFFEVKNLHFLPASSVRLHSYLSWKELSNLKFFTLAFSDKQIKTASNLFVACVRLSYGAFGMPNNLSKFVGCSVRCADGLYGNEKTMEI